MSRHTKPRLDIDQHFREITEGLTDLQKASEAPRSDRITVMLELPHLAVYERQTTVELVYGCQFLVAVGDAVSCPPTPRGDGSWTTGIVVALDGRGYTGPVKQVRKVKKGKK